MQMQKSIKTVSVQEPAKLKLRLSAKSESKIRTACSVFPNNEWGGAAFYKFNRVVDNTTKMEETELFLLDFVLQDIGSATYTEYDLNGDVAAYYADHIDELLGAKVAILHSHDSMAAFFSGTDMTTLNEQASQCNNVLSIVVNNEGSYVAKFTERHTIHDHKDIAVNTTRKDSWVYMGETPDSSTSMSSSNHVEEDDYEEIHCWDCDIDRPLGMAIDEDFKNECLEKRQLFAQHKEESRKSAVNSDYRWPSFFDDDFTLQQGRPVYTMFQSLMHLSFCRYSMVPTFFAGSISEDFLDSFFDAWMQYFQPTDEELDGVLGMLDDYDGPTPDLVKLDNFFWNRIINILEVKTI